MTHRDDAQGKSCPDCGEPMSDIRSQRARVCTHGCCRLVVDWNLKPGQPPLINNNRADRKPRAVGDELALHGWPESDNSPSQQRGELAEVIDRVGKGKR